MLVAHNALLNHLQLKTRLVRDLHWCVTSQIIKTCQASHITFLDEHWLWGIYKDPETFLKKLDENTDELQQILDGRKDYRLGHYFECLLTYWFSKSDSVDIIKSNFAVNINKQTIGEFDYILFDKRTAEYKHIEVAIKFYLGYGEAALLDADFWGPRLKDRLDKKLQRMENHQTGLSLRADVKHILDEENINITKIHCILKGRLFYPSTQPYSEPYQWYFMHQWLKKKKYMPECLVRLTKAQWLSPLIQADVKKEQYLHINPEIDSPVCIARMHAGFEVERYFIVPDDWLPPQEKPQ